MADSRSDHRGESSGSGAGLVLGVLGGAVLGAVGLGWWLLSEADRRRRQRPFQALHSQESAQPWVEEPFRPAVQRSRAPRSAIAEPVLQERVQQLNQAIDEVRRQLEALQPLP